MEDKGINEKEEAIPQKIKFDYIKSNFYRVIHADGVWGGVTPGLDIQIGFFCERLPIPQQVTYEAEADGSIGEEVKSERIVRDAIIREIEATVVLNINDAKALHSWLTDKIKMAEELEERFASKLKSNKEEAES